MLLTKTSYSPKGDQQLLVAIASQVEIAPTVHSPFNFWWQEEALASSTQILRFPAGHSMWTQCVLTLRLFFRHPAIASSSPSLGSFFHFYAPLSQYVANPLMFVKFLIIFFFCISISLCPQAPCCPSSPRTSIAGNS